MGAESEKLSALVFRACDQNGNMTRNARENLDYGYNSLNLLGTVKSGSTVQAQYHWLADGTKAGVKTPAGTQGYEYLGSLVYQRNASGGLVLESAAFGGGRISKTSTSYEPHYHITDHLGSVRVVFVNSSTVRARNDYYAFGKRAVNSLLPAGNDTSNRFLYNGKEHQTTGNLRFLDYGARMYDSEINRWFNLDPLAEIDPPTSPFAYARNNPVSLIDRFGLFAQSPGYQLPGVTVTGQAPQSTGLDFFDEAYFQSLQDLYRDGDQSPLEPIPDMNMLPPVTVTAQMPRKGDKVMGSLSNFWDYFEHYVEGGRKYTYEYSALNIWGNQTIRSITYNVNAEGKIAGIAPNTGMPPAVGAGKAMYIKNVKGALNNIKFHREIIKSRKEKQSGL